MISASTNAKSAEPVACSGESGGLCRQKIQAPSSAAMLLGKRHSPVVHAHTRCVSLHPEAVAEAVDAAASHITQRRAVPDPLRTEWPGGKPVRTRKRMAATSKGEPDIEGGDREVARRLHSENRRRDCEAER